MKVSAGLGLAAFLVFAVAVAVQYGYLASATVAGLTAVGLAVIGVLLAIAAGGFYLYEDNRPYGRFGH